MENIFSKTFSFDAKKQSLFNGSLDILVPNLPPEFDKFHVEVIVTAIQEGDNMLIANVQKEIKTPPKKENAPAKTEPVKAEPVEEKAPEQPATEHVIKQNRQYRNYVQAVKRARRH